MLRYALFSTGQPTRESWCWGMSAYLSVVIGYVDDIPYVGESVVVEIPTLTSELLGSRPARCPAQRASRIMQSPHG